VIFFATICEANDYGLWTHFSTDLKSLRDSFPFATTGQKDGIADFALNEDKRKEE
jgi:hypothetical protein